MPRRLPLSALLLVAPLLAACGTDAPHPVLFQLPTADDRVTAVSFPPGAVTLSVGQRLQVDLAANDGPQKWELTSPVDGNIVVHEADTERSHCPANAAGCTPDTAQVFAGRSPGTITLTWTLRSYAGCTGTTLPKTTRFGCDRGEQRVQITVH